MLRPKKTLFRRLSNSLMLRSPSNSNQRSGQPREFPERDENGDSIMDLKHPPFSLKKSTFQPQSSSSSMSMTLSMSQSQLQLQQASIGITPASEAFTPSPPRKRIASAVQDQIEMAKEAAARFGSSRNLSLQALSPSEMSESNFRTPVPAPRKGWFHIRDQDPGAGVQHWNNSNGNNNNNINNSTNSAVGLFLPGLFSSASEEDFTRHSRSGSLLDLMKGAFSPS